MRAGIISSILVLVALSHISAMPPHKRVIQMIESGQIPKPAFFDDPTFFQRNGIDQGKPRHLAALDNPTGQFRAIALLVRFSDHNSQVAGTYFDNLIFGSTGNTVKDYYSEVSYGNLDIVTVNLPSSVGWRQMPHTYAYYVDGQYGLYGTYPQNAQHLAEDAVAAANPYVDFSNYDNDGDNVVDALCIIHSGPGAEFSGSANDIWSHAWECEVAPYVDGVYVHGYSMVPEYWTGPGDMTCGVYVHEIGHVFGLPDLYDYGYDSKGLGSWSVMAGGSWNGPGGMGGSPAHPDAWCRTFLGFAPKINVTGTMTSAPFPAVEDTSVVYRLWTNGLQGNEYFLAENRQRTGFDAYLPAAGMLIYHVDEAQTGNDNQWYPGHTSFGHYKVALEQADGGWDLEHDYDSGDGGDPYPGSTTNRTLNNTSTPDSKNYASANTYVAITNISNSSMNMTANLSVSNAPAVPNLVAPANGSFVNNVRPLFDFSDSPGATVYHIQIDDNSDFSSPLFNVSNLTSSQYTPTSNLLETPYYWHVRAGNGSIWSSWSTAWTTTIDVTAPGSPAGLTANGSNPSEWTNNSIFSINWSNPSDPSGIQKAFYKLGGAPSSANDTSGSFPSPPPRNLSITAQGGLPVYLWLRDNAGNASYLTASSVVLRYDAIRPTGCLATSPDTSRLTTFRISWSRGSDAGGSGLSGLFDLWVRTDDGAWNVFYNRLPDTTVMISGEFGHTYYFEALNSDNAGNIELKLGVAETSTRADFLSGDANSSGDINGIDVVFLVNFLKGLGPAPEPLIIADANGSCVVNGMDVVYIVNYLKGFGPAPLRGNCP